MLIENPVTVVDPNVDKHCVREVAEAFVEFLHGVEAKEIFADAGYRSTDLATAQAGGGDFPAIEDLWDVDDFGGWDALTEKLFSETASSTEARVLADERVAAQTHGRRSTAGVATATDPGCGARHLGLRGAVVIYLGADGPPYSLRRSRHPPGPATASGAVPLYAARDLRTRGRRATGLTPTTLALAATLINAVNGHLPAWTLPRPP